MHRCTAKQYQNTLRCEECNLTWDIDDPEPPKCLNGRDKFIRMREKLHERTCTTTTTSAERKGRSSY